MFHTEPSSDILTRSNAMKEVLYLQPSIPPKRFDIIGNRQLGRSLGLCITPYYPVEPYSYYLCDHVFSSHPFWTSSSLDVPAGVTQEEGHTGFFIHLLSAVRALIFLARRIQPFLSLVDREVEFCVLTI